MDTYSELVGSLERFDASTHASLGKSATTKDLAGFVSDVVSDAGGLVLEQSNWTSQLLRLLEVGHVAHLVCDILQPVLHRLELRNHASQLVTDNWLVDQALTKHLALVRPLEAECIL